MTKTPDRVGQIIGQRYELLEIIGRGGQGMVYRALDRWMTRQVAVKVLGSKAVREPQVLERLMREQQAMSALKVAPARPASPLRSQEQTQSLTSIEFELEPTVDTASPAHEPVAAPHPVKR